jgi:hypothetical protein
MKVGDKQYRNHIDKQRGSFSVEAVFALLLLSFILLFVGGLSIQIQLKERSERVSYSLVNLLKERTRFFSGNNPIAPADSDLIYDIASDLLDDHPAEDIGLVIESFGGGLNQSFSDGMACQAERPIDSYSELVPVNLEGDVFPIYQVTVCIRSSGLLSLVPGTRVIRSSSLFPGR